MCAKVYAFCCFGGFQRGPAFIEELLSVIPNAQYYKRDTYDLKKIIEYANKKEFTSLIVVHTNHREPDALLIIGLPNGPTAHFKLSKLVLRKDIKNHGNPTSHELELVLNNFTTRLGHRIGRLQSLTCLTCSHIILDAFWTFWFKYTSSHNVSLFPQEPNFSGRRVVTFHNQRDFIFFRHHRYIFETKETKQAEVKGKKTKDSKADAITKAKPFARLQCGPRFTLKLISLQHGTFDPRGGEFEWVHKVIHLSVNSFQYIGFISLS
ncbi:putative anticodon-binding, Brix domain-containing protein [Rosa chinensis]|uniref:Putative anticodon-binding, Brix domain-containing protein n=1 Tax=Rosa chinensis TaxID=74649 RepID=A0A2P6RDH5_ROSCH|nr:putative anticodon-binding, Brix domain-containing protein [Rosa chinensis]